MNRMEDEARTGMPDAIHACLGEISKPTYSLPSNPSFCCTAGTGDWNAAR